MKCDAAQAEVGTKVQEQLNSPMHMQLVIDVVQVNLDDVLRNAQRARKVKPRTSL
jgi:hypothetical protein